MDQPAIITKQRISDDFIVLVLTTGYAVLIGMLWILTGRPLAA